MPTDEAKVDLRVIQFESKEVIGVYLK